MEKNIFEIAARKKLRFTTAIGSLALEDLYDLPLVATNNRGGGKVDLDGVAREANRQLKEIAEESFVELKPDPRRGDLEVKLELVKAVIALKIEAQETAKKRAENAEKRRKLLDALASKEDQELSAKSKEEILRELETLS